MSPPISRAVIGPIAVSVAFVMELTLVPLLLPEIQAAFDLSISQLAWVFNSYGIFVAIGVLMGGWLGDAFNTNRIFGAGVIFFVAGSGFVAIAGNFETLIIGRALQGLGGGIFSPLIPILLTRASPKQPGKILIVWGSIAGYAASAAPLLYSSALTGQGWRLAFFIFAAVAVVALGIVQAAPSRESMPRSTPTRIDYKRLRHSTQLWLMYGYVFCTYGAFTYYLFRLPLLLAENNFRALDIGIVLSVMWLSFSVLSTLLRNRVDEPRVRSIMLMGPILFAAGFPLAYLCNDTLCVALSASLLGAGLACSNAPSTQLILRFAPSGLSAVSASLDITFARLGGVATVAILAETTFGLAAAVIVLMCATALLLALSATRRLGDLIAPGA